MNEEGKSYCSLMRELDDEKRNLLSEFMEHKEGEGQPERVYLDSTVLKEGEREGKDSIYVEPECLEGKRIEITRDSLREYIEERGYNQDADEIYESLEECVR